MTDIDLRRLRYFVCVADSASFRAAAERLYVAQPSLSRQIRSLEKDFGVELFQRSRSGVRLTAAGQELLVEARSLLLSAQELMARTRSGTGYAGGS